MHFKNMDMMDIKNAKTVDIQKRAIAEVREHLGKTIKVGTSASPPIVSVNPFNPEEVVAEFTGLNEQEMRSAIDKAEKAFEKWSRTPHQARQILMRKIADEMEKSRYEFNALLSLEAGKTWLEADGDTCEAIDFIRYYSESLNDWITNENLVRIKGQTNTQRYIPLGVGSVIAPWNFPLAILCGMTVAGMVAGNTVLMKPASDTPLIGYMFHKLLMECGVPSDVVQLIIGRGSEIGDIMVNDPRIRYVCFTGSREVGTTMYENAARVQPNQKWLKRMSMEMGGKDGILVDETADLDRVARDVVAAAFGYSGQKCSACSRLIVVKSVKEKLLEKVLELTACIKIGDPTDVETHMGPVINKSSFDKIGKYIEIGQDEGKIVYGGHKISQMGYTWSPTIFDGIKEDHMLFQEEIFGPVLAVTEAADFEDGIRLMNATEYGLTGSVYSADRDRIEKAMDEVFVGNLYINRKCTGAMVGQHPFGGFNMSGTDSKAGGPEYLGLFLQPKVIAEIEY